MSSVETLAITESETVKDEADIPIIGADIPAIAADPNISFYNSPKNAAAVKPPASPLDIDSLIVREIEDRQNTDAQNTDAQDADAYADIEPRTSIDVPPLCAAAVSSDDVDNAPLFAQQMPPPSIRASISRRQGYQHERSSDERDKSYSDDEGLQDPQPIAKEPSSSKRTPMGPPSSVLKRKRPPPPPPLQGDDGVPLAAEAKRSKIVSSNSYLLIEQETSAVLPIVQNVLHEYAPPKPIIRAEILRANPKVRRLIPCGDEEQYPDEADEMPNAIDVTANDLQEAKDMVNRLFRKWFPTDLKDECHPVMEGVETARIFQVDLENGQVIKKDDFDRIYSDLYSEIDKALLELKAVKALRDPEIKKKMKRILDRLHNGKQLIVGIMGNYWTSMKKGDPHVKQSADGKDDDLAMWRFKVPETDGKMTALQSALISLINNCHEEGFARYRNCFMRPIFTGDGFNTCAWRPVMTVESYVWQYTSKKLDLGCLWYYMTKSMANAKSIIEYMTHSADPEMPWLKPDRTLFSFKNGLYNCRENIFIPFNQLAGVYPYGLPVACRYFHKDVKVDDFSIDDYMKIKTPAMDRLLADQQLSDDVQRWVWTIFIGRMLYNVGEIDDWQIHPFIKGMAQTGKSTFLEVVASIYDKADVGLLPNNIEPQFGLVNLANKMIAIADDVRKNLKIDQSDFQNMAGAQRVSCPRKHMTPLEVIPWLTPVLWSGNELPEFSDNASSISRRWAVLFFAFMVEKVDGSLHQRLAEELPNIIIKGNMAYQSTIRIYGTKQGIWDILPPPFKAQRREVAVNANALAAFLAPESGMVNIDLEWNGKDGTPAYYMTLDDLRDRAKAYAKRNGYVDPKWAPDFWRAPIAAVNCKVRTRTLPYPRIQNGVNPPKEITTTFVLGCEPK